MQHIFQKIIEFYLYFPQVEWCLFLEWVFDLNIVFYVNIFFSLQEIFEQADFLKLCHFYYPTFMAFHSGFKAGLR